MSKGGSMLTGLLFLGVLAGSFLPWGEHGVALDLGIVRFEGQGREITAWDSDIDIGSIELDNWLVVAECGAAALLSILRGNGSAGVPRFITGLLCAAAAAQSIFMAVELNDGGKIGTGLVVTIVAAVAMTLVEGFGKD